MAEETAKRCAHPGCTCHTQEGDEYCSEACRRSAENGTQNGCRCGHAGCTASAYVRRRAGTETRPASAAARGHL